jgi:hypothetical protein
MNHVRVFACVMLILGGCSSGQESYPNVVGRVYYRGEPLPGGLIVFTPDEERGNIGPIAKAAIGPDGRYSLRSEQRTGAVPGWHRISIAAAPAKSRRLQLNQIPPGRYRHPQHSGLAREVKADTANVFDFHLED